MRVLGQPAGHEPVALARAARWRRSPGRRRRRRRRRRLGGVVEPLAQVVRGLWMPGVSTNTTWASGRVSTPRTWVRVVCGLSETIADLLAEDGVQQGRLPDVGSADEGGEAGLHSRSTSVSIETGSSLLMRTRPMRRPCTRSARRRWPSYSHRLALGRHVAEQVEDEPADGVPVALGELGVEELVELVDGHAGVHPHVAAGQRLDGRLLDVVLVDDLARPAPR